MELFCDVDWLKLMYFAQETITFFKARTTSTALFCLNDLSQINFERESRTTNKNEATLLVEFFMGARSKMFIWSSSKYR